MYSSWPSFFITSLWGGREAWGVWKGLEAWGVWEVWKKWGIWGFWSILDVWGNSRAEGCKDVDWLLDSCLSECLGVLLNCRDCLGCKNYVNLIETGMDLRISSPLLFDPDPATTLSLAVLAALLPLPYSTLLSNPIISECERTLLNFLLLQFYPKRSFWLLTTFKNCRLVWLPLLLSVALGDGY